MRFSVGLWDWMFGEKTLLELTDVNGKPVRRQVSVAWLGKMERERRAKRVVKVNILGLNGPREEWYEPSVDKLAELEQTIDANSGELFLIEFYNAGLISRRSVTRAVWEVGKRELGDLIAQQEAEAPDFERIVADLVKNAAQK